MFVQFPPTQLFRWCTTREAVFNADTIIVMLRFTDALPIKRQKKKVKCIEREPARALCYNYGETPNCCESIILWSCGVGCPKIIIRSA